MKNANFLSLLVFVFCFLMVAPSSAQYYPFHIKDRDLKSYSHFDEYDAIREKYVSSKELTAALFSLDSLADFLQSNDPHQYLFLQNEISNLRRIHSQYDESAEKLHSAMKWFAQNADTVHIEYASSLRLIRTVLPYYKKPHFRSSLSLFESNFAILEKLNAHGEPLVNLLVDYGSFLIRSGKQDEGLETLYKARNAAADNDDLLSMVAADYTLLSIINKHDFQQSTIEILKSNLQLLDKQKRSLPILVYSIYYNYLTGKKYYENFRERDLAISYVSKAIECMDTLTYPVWNFNANANAQMALYVAKSGDYDAHFYHYQKAKLFAETKTMSAYNQSLVFLQLGEAAMYFSPDTVLQIAETMKILSGYNNFLFQVLDLEARALRKKGMPAQAIALIESVFDELIPDDGFFVPVINQEVDPVLRLTLLTLLEDCYRTLYESGGNQIHLAASVRFIDEITHVIVDFMNNEIHSQELTVELLNFNEFLKTTMGFLIKHNGSEVYNDKLFNLFASSKALQLSAGLNKSQFQSEIEKDSDGFGVLLKNVAEIQRVKNNLSQNGLSEEEHLGFNRELNKLLVDNLMMKYRFSNQVQNTAGSFQVPRAGQLQTLLQTGEALLEYVLADTAIYWMFCSNEKLVFGVENINNTDSLLSEILFRVKTGREDAQANLLFSEKLAAELANVQRLIIVPDKKMVLFPFETLKNPSTGDYFAFSHEIVYSYSATLWFQMKKQTKPKENMSYLAVAPVFSKEPIESFNNEIFVAYRGHENLSPLFHSRLEAEYLVKLGRKHKRQVKAIIGKDATEREVRKHIEKADVVHFATHGIVNKDNHERSGLFLFPSETKSITGSTSDDFLSLGELLNLKLNADLVVLSACNTGVGGLADGEGVMALPRGFIYAGVPNVVASLWRVHDEKTKEFMQLFYNYLFSGNSYSRALQLARLDCINKGWLPIDWAGFVLIGQ